MTAGENVSPEEARSRRAWYRAAVWAALVAGVFSLAVACLLAWNQRKMWPAVPLDPGGRTAGPLESAEFRDLQAQLKSDPKDARTRGRLRDKDLALRQEYFRRQALADRGRYVLLAGAVVFVVAAGWAVSLRTKLPSPSPAPDAEAEYARAGGLARWAVGAMGVLLAAGAAMLAITPGDAQRLRRSIGVWPRFRGPGGLGISAYTNVPTQWDGKTGQGILWKRPVPLPGENSPVVWADRVFVTGADAKRREVYCFHAHSGKLLWRRPVITPGSGAEPPDPMEDTGFAAPTAAADAERVCAIFANGDVTCFDHFGRQLWARSLGVPENVYGHASSLVLHGQVLLVQYDQGDAEEGKSALLGLDARTGEVLWEAPRPVGSSWATPIVVATDKGDRIITAANPWVIAYDAATALELWRANCLGGDVAPSPVYAAGMVFAVNAEAKLAAIRPGGLGEVTKTHIVWTAEDSLPDIASPLATEEFVFLVTTGGVLSCHAAGDGTRLWQKDIDGNFRSSPTLAGKRVYLLSEGGVMLIFEAGREYQQVGRCELGEPADTCPAFLDGRIYIRARTNLYCIGQAQK